jgi:hypothetical protein
VIALTGEDLVGAVELLEEDDAGQLVRKGERSQRDPVLDRLELEPVGAADDEAELTPALASLLEEAAEADRVELLAVAVKERDEGALGHAPGDLLILSNLDQLEPRVPGEELLIVLDVVDERRSQPTHGDDDDAHDGILRGIWKIPIRPNAT